jgi:hypothetical protein
VRFSRCSPKSQAYYSSKYSSSHSVCLLVGSHYNLWHSGSRVGWMRCLEALWLFVSLGLLYARCSYTWLVYAASCACSKCGCPLSKLFLGRWLGWIQRLASDWRSHMQLFCTMQVEVKNLDPFQLAEWTPGSYR